MGKKYKEIEGEPIFKTSKIVINCYDKMMTAEFDKASRYLSECNLGHKDHLQMELLFEETALMLGEITKDFSALLWFEKYENYCCLKLTAKTEMNFEKKEELISVSSSGENAMAKGFMGKIADIIETGLMDFDYVARLQQEYGGVNVGFGSMGIYDGYDGLGDMNAAWCLSDYRSSLNDAIDDEGDENEASQEAWDELEKSIVASIAEDVIVGTKSNVIEMTIVKALKHA